MRKTNLKDAEPGGKKRLKPAIAVIAVIIAAFLISGCSLIGTISDKASTIRIPGIEQAEETAGTITVSIVSPRHGAEVPKSSRLAPVIRISNLGGYEAEGQACITGGLDKDVFSGFTGCECQSFKMEKKYDGTFDNQDLRFGPYAIKYKEGETKEHGFSTVARFGYDADINANICIPEDIYAAEECGAQIIVTDKLTGKPKSVPSILVGQLQVTGIEEITTPPAEGEDENALNVMLKINVQNTGSGRLITETDFNEPCKALSFEELPRIQARVKNFPTNDLITCDDVEFEGDSATIICRGIVNLVKADGTAVFAKGQNPEIQFQLRYFYELRQSSRFRLV